MISRSRIEKYQKLEILGEGTYGIVYKVNLPITTFNIFQCIDKTNN